MPLVQITVRFLHSKTLLFLWLEAKLLGGLGLRYRREGWHEIRRRGCYRSGLGKLALRAEAERPRPAKRYASSATLRRCGACRLGVKDKYFFSKGGCKDRARIRGAPEKVERDPGGIAKDWNSWAGQEAINQAFAPE